MIVDSLVIAIVGYCITLSMAKIFANKFDYKLDGNQEMFGEVSLSAFEIRCICVSFDKHAFK